MFAVEQNVCKQIVFFLLSFVGEKAFNNLFSNYATI